MKNIALASMCFAAGVALAASRGPAAAPEQDPPADEAMARWMATIQPGEQHELLKRFEGEWDSVLTMSGMGAPIASAGTSTSRAVLGGRFIMSNDSTTMMGQPWESVSFLGFDRFKNKFIACSMSTMGTNMLTMEGLLDQAGKVITLYGPMDEPMTGEHDKTVKYVFRLIDENNYVFEIHDLGIVPGETKVIEVKYTRKND